MVLALAIGFLLVPFAELYVIVQISHLLGLVPTLGLLIVISLVGAKLVKQQGWRAWRAIHQQLAAGRVPGTAVIDGFLILLAGALLLTPGFITDTVGLLLLLPPVRAAARAGGRVLLARRVEARVVRGW